MAKKKQDLRTLLTRQLGKDTAVAMLNKLDRLAKRGASAAQIEKVFLTDLTREVESRVGSLMGTAVHTLDGLRTLVAVHAKK